MSFEEDTRTTTKGWRPTPKEIGAAVVAVLAVIFCLMNTTKPTVNVFGWKPHTYLWLWMLILLVVGVLIGMLMPYGRSRKKD